MIREQIEQAAKEAVQNYFPCNGKYPCEERNYCKFCNGYNSAFDCDEDCSADDFNEGFIDGAQWRINSVWHDASEKPKFKGKVEKEMFMLFCNSKKYGLMLISQDEWDDFVERGMFHKWAYVDDLLPERKEDAE